ncbi:Uncharacterised protein [Mycolicibacterium vanbaalenii]|uniref:Uncharacterized protein n=1 Tax=Mycolicibacterium vanbaalenii TaxID=110539 RepID=A0A5S9RBT8_MYCVN|nr:hypothetical protein [Mycolicibacterium vanbaalenii]CAA0136348.1 Uncharacterised protein [Mycolicibacterium vanbaalenii]
MSQFRIIGVACDAYSRWNNDGDRFDTYGPNAVGEDCGEEFTLMGGATFTDVVRDAKREGWTVKGKGRSRVYLCAAHRDAKATQ